MIREAGKGMGSQEEGAERGRIVSHLKDLLEEEISEAGSRIVKAVIAEREGFPEAALVLREVAADEANHAFLIAEFLPEPPFGDTKSNLEASVEADADAARRESEFAKSAREAGMGKIAELLERLSAEEMEHVAKLRESLDNLAELRLRPETRRAGNR